MTNEYTYLKYQTEERQKRRELGIACALLVLMTLMSWWLVQLNQPLGVDTAFALYSEEFGLTAEDRHRLAEQIHLWVLRDPSLINNGDRVLNLITQWHRPYPQ